MRGEKEDIMLTPFFQARNVVYLSVENVKVYMSIYMKLSMVVEYITEHVQSRKSAHVLTSLSG